MKKMLFFTNRNQKKNVFCRKKLERYLGNRLQNCCTVMHTACVTHVSFWSCSRNQGSKV